jgi:hypothetical protein
MSPGTQWEQNKIGIDDGIDQSIDRQGGGGCGGVDFIIK